MAQKRDNCIILLIDAPVPERIAPELISAFGAERAERVNLDLLQNAYKLAKKFKDAILLLSFDKSSRHPDLTWLDSDDPGFLEAKGKNPEERINEAFQLAFNTGAKKALLLNHLSPEVKPEWLHQTFDAVADKTISLGANRDGSLYLVGLTFSSLKILEGLSFLSVKAAEEISERAKKNKLGVFSLPETDAVKTEDSLLKWADSKDSSPSPFMRAEPSFAAAPPEEKRSGRRAHKNTSPPAAEKPPLQ
ncbi:MAG: hypothetical protein A2X28_00940 [Elusimicrobia bacterium GWA2_56_46]|nr:MAG: hypothetical protein A2X28_00940 [Elusimicrobia bacterium GWA2_56_46]OGR55929.1 MAG: hypothetical protein A2X39_06305 [Elusimicrobia bacterium GWC2_56_31]HBB67498.1 hypothetical protein [Elusimicrobiota bacterium]HBW22134.1 hypothetical protein [Elusimicrobiota bacterium]